MLRIVLIGVGDLKFHYQELLKISEQKLNSEIETIAKTLAVSGNEIVLLPDWGINFEVAKKFKEFGGKKTIATIPFSDTDFGIKNLEPYMNAQVNGKKLFDETIDTGSWYKQDMTCCLLGDVVLMLGSSLGSIGELVYGYYLYKLFFKQKPKVEAMKQKINPQIRAGESIPFSVICYKPFLKEKLNYEIEEYIKKLDGKIYYVNNAVELKEILLRLKRIGITTKQ